MYLNCGRLCKSEVLLLQNFCKLYPTYYLIQLIETTRIENDTPRTLNLSSANCRQSCHGVTAWGQATIQPNISRRCRFGRGRYFFFTIKSSLYFSSPNSFFLEGVSLHPGFAARKGTGGLLGLLGLLGLFGLLWLLGLLGLYWVYQGGRRYRPNQRFRRCGGPNPKGPKCLESQPKPKIAWKPRRFSRSGNLKFPWKYWGYLPTYVTTEPKQVLKLLTYVSA